MQTTFQQCLQVIHKGKCDVYTHLLVTKFMDKSVLIKHNFKVLFFPPTVKRSFTDTSSCYNLCLIMFTK